MTVASDSRTAETSFPRPSAFGPLTLPARDMAQSRRFFTEVLGGELIDDGPNPKVRFGTFVIALGAQDGGATLPHNEHPHYAFLIPPEDFRPLKERLDAFGVPTHEPWCRAGSPASLMYFRDPTGNQFELYCIEGDIGLPKRIGARAGGDFTPPFRELVYSEVKDPAGAPPDVRVKGFSHMTIPSRDLGESKRFLTEIFGGRVSIDHPSHVTVVVADTEIGNGGPMKEGWPAPNAEYPHYTLVVGPSDLQPLHERLASYGVPTSDVFTTDGTDAAVYYRDPSGNLWKLHCPTGFTGAARRTKSAGGDYAPDLPALSYDHWKDPASGTR
jgi:catechol 2,3-dioxygenase-like lactoylglutathione lyase family enzyme